MQQFIVLVPLALVVAQDSHGTVTAITNRSQWLSTVGSHTYIGFTEFPEFTIITDQYAENGVAFTDGNDFIFTSSSFPSDGAGLVGADPLFGTISMAFVESRFALAFEFTGTMQVALYANATLLYTSSIYVGGFNPFIGFVSTEPFDSAVAMDPSGSIVTLDNLYFGAPVPAPAAGVVWVGMILSKSRRRS
jgi:hypothetical protein